MKNLIIFSTLAFALIFASCGNRSDANETASEEARLPLVRTAVAVEREVPQTANFTANVQPEAVNHIVPGVPARIRRIFVEVGDRVTRGQRLAQMDDVNLGNLQLQVNTLRETYGRMTELLRIGGISQQEVDNLRMQLNLAEANLRNMQENTILTSPINGVVTARNFDEGDFFGTAPMPLLTVMQVNPVKITINIPESHLVRVQRGMPVDITFDVFENETFEGTVTLIHPTVDPITRSFRVDVTLPNADLRIRPGMFARVSVNFGDAMRVLVPDRSIVRQPGTGDRYVFRLNADNTVSYIQVQLGNRVGSYFEVLSGIEAGDTVIIAGLEGLIDGMEVEEVR